METYCISLLFTTYDIISVNLKLVSFLIPLTIFCIALFNIFTSGKKTLHTNKVGILLFVTLFLGLIHGLGFANDLNGMITSSENKLLAIFEIALGLAVGQLVIAFIVIFLSFICQTIFRFSKRDWVMVISAVVAGFVLPMLIQSELLS